MKGLRIEMHHCTYGKDDKAKKTTDEMFQHTVEYLSL